jgi:hypothetical protein
MRLQARQQPFPLCKMPLERAELENQWGQKQKTKTGGPTTLWRQILN